jgi:hypothetical protein
MQHDEPASRAVTPNAYEATPPDCVRTDKPGLTRILPRVPRIRPDPHAHDCAQCEAEKRRETECNVRMVPMREECKRASENRIHQHEQQADSGTRPPARRTWHTAEDACRGQRMFRPRMRCLHTLHPIFPRAFDASRATWDNMASQSRSAGSEQHYRSHGPQSGQCRSG